ncbi:MAG: GerMN domain-containing protein, partial [Synergistaceae bacterium]|nr:GerMN domain-containing protein [Synergistaceae bacterium]
MTRRKSDGYSERYRDETRDAMLERELEERIEAKRRRSHPRHSDLPKREKKTKAPLLLRMLAWCGVILLCFVAGYLGASSMLTWLDKPLNEEEAGSGGTERGGRSPSLADVKLDMQKTSLSLFYPQKGVLLDRKAEIISSTFEDNIQEAVHKLISLSDLFGQFAKDVYVKHVFRNVDVVYLDFAGPFVSALNAAGAESSTLFITGLVRTMRDNFHPVTKVRFLVDS